VTRVAISMLAACLSRVVVRQAARSATDLPNGSYEPSIRPPCPSLSIPAGRGVESLSKAQSKPLSGTLGLHFRHLEHVFHHGRGLAMIPPTP
jgi:hypothetical protein